MWTKNTHCLHCDWGEELLWGEVDILATLLSSASAATAPASMVAWAEYEGANVSWQVIHAQPNAEIGRTLNHAPNSQAVEASRRACALALEAVSSRDSARAEESLGRPWVILRPLQVLFLFLRGSSIMASGPQGKGITHIGKW